MKNQTYLKIKKTFDEIIKLYNNELAFEKDYDLFHLFEFKVKNKIDEKLFSVILPKEEAFSIELLTDISGIPVDVRIVDLFENLEVSRNVIKPPELFNYICNLSNYEDYMSDPDKYRIHFEDYDSDWADLSNTYIPRKDINFIHNIHLSEKLKDEIELVQSWEKKSTDKNPLLILGERGIGKTWFLKRFCQIQFERFKDDPWNNPPVIYVNLRILKLNKENIQDISDALRFYLKKYQISFYDDYNFFFGLLRAERIILALDGLDEVSLEINQNILSKNIWDILSLTRHTKQIILTSRSNLFDNAPQLFKYFAYSKYLEKTKKKEVKLIASEDKIRIDFNIVKLGYFTDNEISQLINANLAIDKPKEFELLDNRLGKIKNKKKRDFIEEEIYSLSRIAEFGNFFIKNEHTFLFNSFEQSIENLVFDFNIEQGRAIFNQQTLDLDNQEIINEPFDKYIKYERIQKLAWILFDNNIDEFKIDNLPYKYIKTYPSLAYDEIALNDLKTQTVLNLNEDRDTFSFISESVFSYFVALHLFSLIDNNSVYVDNFKLENPELPDEKIRDYTASNQLEGIKILGKYNFIGKNKKILLFLKEKLIYECSSDNNINHFDILENLSNTLFKDRIYSPWTRNLNQNLNVLGACIESTDCINSWLNFPIDYPKSDNCIHKLQDRLIYIPHSQFILTNNNVEKLNHFLISETEITNKMFSQFIENCRIDNKLNGLYWKRNGEFWQNEENPFYSVINDYHLLLWSNGKCPSSILDHPVVYISWFCAAQYCNWLSISEGIEPYYIFDFQTTNDQNEGIINTPVVSINNSSFGYRLPSIKEWELVEMEGILNNNEEKIWDRIINPVEKENVKIEFYKTKLETFPIKSSKENQFGIYGMIHNVREWVDWGDKKDNIVNWKDTKPFLGPTWLLGDKGANLLNRHKIMAQNTNIDQGFRIARSLSPSEEINVREAKKVRKIK